MKNKSDINNLELVFYFIFWIFSIIYSIYSITVSANEYFSSTTFTDNYEDFSEGWSILNRLQDISDHEWKYVKKVVINIFPWCIFNILVAEYFKSSYIKLLPYWYATISVLYILSSFGFKILIYFLFQPILGYIVLKFRNKTIIWLYFFMCLTIINYIKWLNFEIYNLYDYFGYITTSGIFWVNLRSLNYFLYAVEEEEISKFNLKNVIICVSYCLYLPFLFTGPLVLFSDFKTVFVPQKTKNITQRIEELIKYLLRFTFWAIFIEFSLHFVYINALTFHAQVFENLNSWALYGAGYCMGQYFHLKYVVFYGFSTSLANFESIPVPKTPKCIATIHLYSDMWKYFDRGLYLFLLRYIYIPVCGEKKLWFKKLLGSFLCFFFVYIWHGTQNFIAIWSFLNFAGVAIETIVYGISQKTFATNITKNITNSMYRRLKCLLAAPLFAMSAISNFYFFAGKQVGDIYVERFLKGPFWITFNIVIILYFGSQVSLQLKYLRK